MLALTLGVFCLLALSCEPKQRLTVSIEGEQFMLNGEATYKGRYWEGHKIEGLLMNSRMVQGIFDDMNQETAGKWKYPDTGTWGSPEKYRGIYGSYG